MLVGWQRSAKWKRPCLHQNISPTCCLSSGQLPRNHKTAAARRSSWGSCALVPAQSEVASFPACNAFLSLSVPSKSYHAEPIQRCLLVPLPQHAKLPFDLGALMFMLGKPSKDTEQMQIAGQAIAARLLFDAIDPVHLIDKCNTPSSHLQTSQRLTQ